MQKFFAELKNCHNFATFLKHNNIVLLLIQKEMKKLVLFLAVAFSATMFSCGSADKAENNCDSACCDTVVAAVEEVAVVDSAATDSAAADTVVAEVAEVVAE